MGLDDFMDLEDDESSTSPSSESQETDKELTDREGIVKTDNGDVGPRGPYGYQDIDEFRETIEGDIEVHEDLFKYHLPIFPQIEKEIRYNQGERYKLSSTSEKYCCSVVDVVPLYTINREIVMLDTGKTSREECMAVLEERFGEEVNPDDTVAIHFFANTRHIVKMALGDELTDSWSTGSKDSLLKAVYGETWTQRFRDIDSENYEYKHTNHIKEW